MSATPQRTRLARILARITSETAKALHSVTSASDVIRGSKKVWRRALGNGQQHRSAAQIAVNPPESPGTTCTAGASNAREH